MNDRATNYHEIRTALAIIRGRAQLANRWIERHGIHDQHATESNDQIINETRKIEMTLVRMEDREPLSAGQGIRRCPPCHATYQTREVMRYLPLLEPEDR